MPARRGEAPFWRGCADSGDGSEQMVDDQHDDADDVTDTGVIVDSVPNPTLSRVEELGPRVS